MDCLLLLQSPAVSICIYTLYIINSAPNKNTEFTRQCRARLDTGDAEINPVPMDPSHSYWPISHVFVGHSSSMIVYRGGGDFLCTKKVPVFSFSAMWVCMFISITMSLFLLCAMYYVMKFYMLSFSTSVLIHQQVVSDGIKSRNIRRRSIISA